ncbi:MAG: phosphodiester glycosidase family protein [Bacteroidetes bacterium]|nr:phosphodiester glycosidase family protein [Bacteroidota bacterium]
MKTLIVLFFSLVSLMASAQIAAVSYIADPGKDDLRMYWRDSSGKLIGHFAALKEIADQQNRQLIFAMNGGMYMEDRTPVGLYIENKKTVHPLNTGSGKGNFYIQPNGVFYIRSDRHAGVCSTRDFGKVKDAKYATQSGPMLIKDGKINAAFDSASHNLNIRNGVGILPDGRVLFAMSKGEVTFYQFATYFADQGCRNALYLDGYVSRTYLPRAGVVQIDDSRFGVLIAVMQ